MRKSTLLAVVVVALLALVVCLFALAGYLGMLPSLRANHAMRLAAGAAALSAASLPPGTAPAPAGYRNNAGVMAAVALKRLKLVATQVPTPSDVQETRDVEYGRVGDHRLLADVYRPAWRTGKPAPALIFIHGGGWSSGKRDIYKLYAVRFARLGYVAATISYRLAGEAPFPAAVQDVKCAVRWARDEGARYGVDPDKVAVVGGSAGGHLAMMAGYAKDVPEFENVGGHTNVTSRVAAVVDFYGPYDLTTDFARQQAVVTTFLGGKSYAEAAELYLQASPVRHLKAGAPPTLIFHGTIDDIVPVEQADQLARRLQELRVPFIYDRLEGWPHTLDLAEVVNERCVRILTAFLDRHLPLPK